MKLVVDAYGTLTGGGINPGHIWILAWGRLRFGEGWGYKKVKIRGRPCDRSLREVVCKKKGRNNRNQLNRDDRLNATQMTC